VRLEIRTTGHGRSSRKAITGTSLLEVLNQAREWLGRRAERRTRRAMRRVLGRRRTGNEGTIGHDRVPDQTVRHPAEPSAWLDVTRSERLARRPEPGSSAGVLWAEEQQLKESQARLSNSDWPPPRGGRKAERKAASLIGKAAKRRRVKKELASSVIAAILQRRLERKRCLAARLVQWTWKRRRGLRKTCAVGSRYIHSGRRELTCNPNEHGVRVPVVRPVPRCLYGSNLAGQAEFDKQKEEGDRVLHHWESYVRIFQRVFKRSMIVGDLFCSEGLASLGMERLQVTAKGADIEYQPQYAKNFGEDSFVQGDATLETTLNELGHVDGYWASPPCQGSTLRLHVM
jgi:hypothetical protein